MKKGLSIVAALASVVTIGGVYATWTYADEAADIASSSLAHSLTGTEFEGKVGNISVVSDGTRIVFDDTDDNYVAEFFFLNGIQDVPEVKATITFTPNAGADNSNTVLNYKVLVDGFYKLDGNNQATDTTSVII